MAIIIGIEGRLAGDDDEDKGKSSWNQVEFSL